LGARYTAFLTPCFQYGVPARVAATKKWGNLKALLSTAASKLGLTVAEPPEKPAQADWILVRSDSSFWL
jgi:hypothetical protein